MAYIDGIREIVADFIPDSLSGRPIAVLVFCCLLRPSNLTRMNLGPLFAERPLNQKSPTTPI